MGGGEPALLGGKDLAFGSGVLSGSGFELGLGFELGVRVSPLSEASAGTGRLLLT